MDGDISGKIILVVPSAEKGRGGGHLLRSMVLVSALRKKNRNAFLFVKSTKEDDLLPEFVSSVLGLKEDFDSSWICRKPDFLKIPDKENKIGFIIDFIIIDNFRTGREEIDYWRSLAPVFGIDEGGKFRQSFNFLIDLLPGIMSPPNITAAKFLPLPENKKKEAFNINFSGEKPLKILISFGLEDLSGLGITAAKSLAEFSVSGAAGIIFLSGDDLEIKGIQCRKKIPELKEHLAEYDLLITHFGLTAFEALFAGTSVLLVSPSAYHKKLALNSCFFFTGKREKSGKAHRQNAFYKRKRKIYYQQKFCQQNNFCKRSRF